LPIKLRTFKKKLDSVLRYRVYITARGVEKMRDLSIGQLARKSRVNVETIRFYERRGLIPEPPRRESGYRQYSEDGVSRIQFIKRAKELGFSLKEISELLSLRVDPDTTCGDVKKRAEAKIAEVEEKMRALQRIKKALTKLVALCRGSGPTSECPIIEALSAEGL
jgi:Hg(II)-responsive transcriptional regulator